MGCDVLKNTALFEEISTYLVPIDCGHTGMPCLVLPGQIFFYFFLFFSREVRPLDFFKSGIPYFLNVGSIKTQTRPMWTRSGPVTGRFLFTLPLSSCYIEL